MAYNICKKLVGREALLQYEGMEQGPEPRRSAASAQ